MNTHLKEITDHSILNAIKNLHEKFTPGVKKEAFFTDILKQFIRLGESEFGFFSEVDKNSEGNPFLRILSSYPLPLKEEHILNLGAQDTLYAHTLKTGRASIFQEQELKKQPQKFSFEHPPLKNFIAIPIQHAQHFIGVVGLCNFKNPLNATLTETYAPLTQVCGSLISHIQNRIKIQKLEKQFWEQANAINQSAIVAVTDRRGVILYANENFCKISKYKDEELLGQTHSILNSGIHSKSFFSDMWTTILSGKIWKGEICNKAKDDSLYWVDTTLVPFLDETHKPYQFLAIRNDITEKKRLTLTLEHDRIKLLQASKMATLGEMAGGVAHEINNPLAIITGFAENLQAQAESGTFTREQILATAKKIIITVERITKIIQGLRNFARDGSRDPFSTENIYQITKEALDLCQSRFKNKQVSLRFPENTTATLFVECKPVQIAQVILNLLSNAFDAAYGTPNAWIELQITDQTQFVEISVIDSGPGVPLDIADKIFAPFFTTKGPQRGTGLGLSISLSIVLDHHGRLFLDQTAPNTRFVIHLPKKVPQSTSNNNTSSK